ncbi:MAG: hypothetical protein WAW46_07620 [Polaromonas sp.]
MSLNDNPCPARYYVRSHRAGGHHMDGQRILLIQGRPYASARHWCHALAGRSARVVATMGMPAFLYRGYFRAHGLKSLEPNILGFVGMAPVHETLIGTVSQLGEAGGKKWLAKVRAMGLRAA